MRPWVRAEHGFTLLEVVIAFAIAGMAVSALLANDLHGLQLGAGAARRLEALALARSRLAAVESAISAGEPAPPLQEGEESRAFRWSTTLKRTASATLPQPQRKDALRSPHVMTLYAIVVTIAWTEDARVQRIVLSSARVGLGGSPP